jgi:hypothetical protein
MTAVCQKLLVWANCECYHGDCEMHSRTENLIRNTEQRFDDNTTDNITYGMWILHINPGYNHAILQGLSQVFL